MRKTQIPERPNPADLTEYIKYEMVTQYGSVKDFSRASGIPNGTLQNALKKGIGGTAYYTVCKICGKLGIENAFTQLPFPQRNADKIWEICRKIGSVDDYGIHTLSTMLEVEKARICREGGDREEPSEFSDYTGIEADPEDS